jgi:hypothetical protein
MRHFLIRFFVLGFFVATLLSSEGASVLIARADVGLTDDLRTAVGPIGLGFNYAGGGGSMIAVVYAPPNSGVPPAPVVQGAEFYPAISLGTPNTAVTGTYLGSGLPTQDTTVMKPGSLYLYVQCGTTTPCAQNGWPLNLGFSGGGPGIMVVYSKDGSTPQQTPAGYSSGLRLGTGINAVWDGNANDPPTSTATNGSQPLFVFLLCPCTKP